MEQEGLKKWHYILLLLWGALLTSLLFLYLNFLQPSKLVPLIEETLYKSFPGESHFKSIKIQLFPRIGLEVEKLSYINTFGTIDFEANIENLIFEVSWLSLFSGNIEVAEIVLNQANFNIIEKNHQENNISEKKSLTLPESLYDIIHPSIHPTLFQVNNARIAIYLNNKTEYITTSRFNLELDAFTSARLTIKDFVPVFLTDSQKFPDFISIPTFNLNIKNIILNKEGLFLDTALDADINFFGKTINNNLKTNLSLTISPDLQIKPFSQDIDIITNFKLPSQSFDARTLANVNFINPKEIHIPKASIKVDDDELQFSASIKDLFSEPTALADVNVEHFSLTRWFDFARSLPPGLAQELDALSGSFLAYIDMEKIKTDNLKAYTKNKTELNGNALYEYGKNKLTLNTLAEYVDVNNLFPEVNGESIAEINFKKPPVTVDFDSSGSFDYDININANNIDFWKYSAKDVAVSILPLDEDIVEIPIKINNFANGMIDSRLLIQDSMTIETKSSNISLEKVFEPLTETKIISGTLQATTRSVLGKSTNFLESLACAKTKGNINIKNGAFYKDFEKIPFNTFSLITDVVGLGIYTPDPQIHFIEGSYKVSYEDKNTHLLLDIPQGKLAYNIPLGLPYSLDSTNANLTLTAKAFKFTTEAKGELKFNIPQEKISLSNLSGSISSLLYSGNISLNSFNTMDITGNLKGNTSNFSKLLNTFTVVPALEDKTALKHLVIEFPFNYKNDTLKIDNFLFNFDSTNTVGSFEYNTKKQTQARLDIHAKTLNLDRYTTLEYSSNEHFLSSNKLIPIDFINKLNLRGTLKIDKLWAMNTPFISTNIPYSFTKGVFSISPTALFSNSGSFAVYIEGFTGKQDLTISTKLKAKDIDLLSLTKARGDKNLIAGSASTTVDFKTKAKRYSDIYKYMDGKFSVWLEKGYFASALPQTKQRDISQPPSPSILEIGSEDMYYSSISANGNIKNGVFTSSDINMHGRGFSFEGKGNMNLPKWTVALNGKAYMGQVAVVPVDIKGSLSDPQLTIKLIQTITSTLSSITGGLINTIKDFIEYKFNIIPKIF